MSVKANTGFSMFHVAAKARTEKGIIRSIKSGHCLQPDCGVGVLARAAQQQTRIRA